MVPLNPPALQSSIRKLTDVVAVYDAGTISPCRAGDKLVLHVMTTSGEVVIRCSERAFVQGCRGKADANGNLFRDLQLVDVDQRRANEAAALPPPAPVTRSGATHRKGGAKLTPDRHFLYEAVIKHRGQFGCTWKEATAVIAPQIDWRTVAGWQSMRLARRREEAAKRLST